MPVKLMSYGYEYRTYKEKSLKLDEIKENKMESHMTNG